MPNDQIIKFVDSLVSLCKQMGLIFKTGNIALLSDMNRTVKEMHAIQHGSEETELIAVDEDCEVIYRNFDMIVGILKSLENGEVDPAAQLAINKFLHNVNTAALNIANTFGLV